MITIFLVFCISLLILSYIKYKKDTSENKSFKNFICEKSTIISNLKITVSAVLILLNVLCVYCVLKSPYKENLSVNNMTQTEFSLNDFEGYEENDNYKFKIKGKEYSVEKDKVEIIQVDYKHAKSNTGIYIESEVINTLTYRNKILRFLIKDFYLEKTNLFKNNINQIDKENKSNYSSLVIYEIKK